MGKYLIVASIICLGHLYIKNALAVDKYEAYDYHIDVYGDSITVYTQEGKVETVHADSLHSFIIRDNL